MAKPVIFIPPSSNSFVKANKVSLRRDTMFKLPAFFIIRETTCPFTLGKEAAQRLQTIVQQSRKDLEISELWFISQQKLADHESVNQVDVVSMVAEVATRILYVHIKAFDLPPQEKRLVITTEGIVRLGELLANQFLKSQQ